MNIRVCPVCQSPMQRLHRYIYIECGCCGAYYLRRMPRDSFINRAIERYAVATHGDPKNSKLISVQRRRIHDIAQFKKRGAKLLDVGCGMGQFVLYAKSQGYHVAAMDKAIPLVKHLRGTGVRSFTDLAQIPNKEFDIVTAFDVIEHVKNPYAFLSEVKTKIKNNGILILTTPNPRGISSRIIPSLLTQGRDGYSEHLILYTIPSLTMMLVNAGFIPVAVSTDILLSWCRAENTLLRKCLNKLAYLSLRPFFPPLFAHGLGDNIQIIAHIRQ